MYTRCLSSRLVEFRRLLNLLLIDGKYIAQPPRHVLLGFLIPLSLCNSTSKETIHPFDHDCIVIMLRQALLSWIAKRNVMVTECRVLTKQEITVAFRQIKILNPSQYVGESCALLKCVTSVFKMWKHLVSCSEGITVSGRGERLGQIESRLELEHGDKTSLQDAEICHSNNINVNVNVNVNVEAYLSISVRQ